MKLLKPFLMAFFAVLSISLLAQTQKTDTIKVYGNCGMCKSRIEKAIKSEFVSKADWDDETKLMVVTYNPAKTSNDEIQKKIAAVGHDTEKYSADSKVYDKLPGCCLYDRKETKNKKKDDHKH